MRDELRKVLYSPYALILLCLTVLINGAFFYRHCTGPADYRHTYPQLREKLSSGAKKVFETRFTGEIGFYPEEYLQIIRTYLNQ